MLGLDFATESVASVCVWVEDEESRKFVEAWARELPFRFLDNTWSSFCDLDFFNWV